MIIKPKISDRQRLRQLFANRPTKTRGLSMPEFSETTVVTAGPRKGEKFQLAYAEYLRRPMELASPESSNQLVILMFPAQSGKSAYLQIFHGYYAKEVPSEGLYVTSDLKQAKKAMERRFEPLFKSIGVTFRTQSTNPGSRKTGDVTFSKEFDGGNLDIATKNSSGDLASETKKVGSYDEIDRGKEILGVEGSSWDQFEARFNAWLSEAKLNVASTPTDIDISAIYQLYLSGTQEEWFMPCPLCGKHQILTTKDKSGWGLDYETRLGNVIEKSIVYVCQHCAKPFKEIHKFDMLQNGIWRLHKDATPPVDDYTTSFHLTALNSMFYSWFKVAKKYEAGIENIEKKKSFHNLVMGLPFKQVGSRPKASAVIENQGDYPSSTVPDGVIYVTSGFDVQRGSNRWRDMTDTNLEQAIAKAIKEGNAHEKKFPRLECEWIGKGPGYRTWSINYKVFYGRVGDAFSGAWEKLNDYKNDLIAENGVYGFIRQKDGRKFPVVTGLVDSGYRPEDGEEGNPHTVYMFCGRWDTTYPSKGFKLLKKSKLEQKKQPDKNDFVRYRWAKVDNGQTTLCEFSGNFYKQWIYNSLRKQRIDHDIQPPAFQDFPRDYPPRYFEGLTAEEKLIDGNYDNAGRWNDPLDCHVMAEVAADVYLDAFTRNLVEGFKLDKTITAAQLREVNHKYAVLLLSRNAGIDSRFNESPQRNHTT